MLKDMLILLLVWNELSTLPNSGDLRKNLHGCVKSYIYKAEFNAAGRRPDLTVLHTKCFMYWNIHYFFR